MRTQRPTIPTTGPKRAFTLVELMVVGALLALFAGLAVYGINRAYVDNQRKAVISETRQIATALDLAKADIGFFPALCFLQSTAKEYIRQSIEQPDAWNALNDGRAVLWHLGPYLNPTNGRETTILGSWSEGGYLATAQGGRSGLGGRQGSRSMALYSIAGCWLGNYDWPTDAFGTPYVLYDLVMDPDRENSLALNRSLATSPHHYETAVVSYGRNRVPGGGDNDPEGLGNADTLRLFEGNPQDQAATLRYVMERLHDNRHLLAGAWSASLPSASIESMARNSRTGDAIGIIDPGSDDIVFTF